MLSYNKDNIVDSSQRLVLIDNVLGFKFVDFKNKSARVIKMDIKYAVLKLLDNYINKDNLNEVENSLDKGIINGVNEIKMNYEKIKSIPKRIVRQERQKMVIKNIESLLSKMTAEIKKK